ncbi:MAG TPA: cytochrome c oxidase assembly protein [Candidatus Binataceae bacterium]|jgi:putative membrane protein
MYPITSIADTALATWRFPWWTSGLLLLTVTLYARGFAGLHRQMPSRFPLRRLGFFLAGTAAIALALISPLEALDEALLTAHMVQHLLLLTIAPPLLLLGAPQIPMIRGIPPKLAKRTIGIIAKSHSCKGLFRFVTHPVSAFLLFSVAMLGWHLPGPFETALRSDYWHALEHGCFLSAGMIFWYPILRPWPAVEQWTRWAFVPYLLIADAENSVLAAFMVFSGRVIYSSYANQARIDGIPAITDQVVAGAVMWLPGSMPFLIPAIVIVIRALQPSTLATPRSGHYMHGVGVVDIH